MSELTPDDMAEVEKLADDPEKVASVPEEMDLTKDADNTKAAE